MQLLQLIKLILTILPLIIDVIRSIEAAMPEGGRGQDKLALVRGAVLAAYETASDVTVEFEKAWPVIERTIGTAVEVFNRVGLFKKGQ